MLTTASKEGRNLTPSKDSTEAMQQAKQLRVDRPAYKYIRPNATYASPYTLWHTTHMWRFLLRLT
jgi:hypothetical protein